MGHDTSCDWQCVPPGAGAATLVAALLAAYVRRALQTRGAALLALSGGRTPVDTYHALAATAPDWSQVCIAPTDERWVPVGHPDSNETMLRSCFAQSAAAAPQFLSLRGAATSMTAAVSAAQALLHPYAQPFDLTVLGVGEDGHIASLFPGAAELGAALAADAPGDVFAVNPPATAPPPKVPRLTLGLRRLLWSRQLVLLCAGVAKRRVVEAAMHTQDLARCPVGALFQPGVPPLQLIYLE